MQPPSPKDRQRAPNPSPKPDPETDSPSSVRTDGESAASKPSDAEEVGGPEGPEPTRYGDWERKGRCIDF